MRGSPIQRRRWRRIAAACAAMVLLAGAGTRAGEVADAKVKIERVALFKNGLGYFTSSATLPDGVTTVRLGQLPVPSHGTFWMGYPQDVKVRSVVTGMEEVEEVTAAQSLMDLLRANVGREVTIGAGKEGAADIRGTIVQVVSASEPAAAPSPYVMDVRRPPSERAYSPYSVGQLAIIRTESGTVALQVGAIARVDFEGDDVATRVRAKLKRPSIRVELEKAAGGKAIGVSYLARGITWSPSYLIDISDPKTAKLSAKAVVVNEVADLRGVRLELVTGFPNLTFGDVTSPVAMSQNLEGFLKALTTGRSETGDRSHLMQQRAVLSNIARYDEGMSAAVPGYSTARDGTVSEDLFLYPLEDFTLARKETACIPLFTAEVEYEHIYIWKIPDMLDEEERYRRERDRDQGPAGEEVWHSCRLVNHMKMPWTTAAAEFVKDGQITGQDTCYYTAPGAETTIRINRAMNVLAEEVELESERERNAARFHGYAYDLVKIKGELKLHNRLKKSATVEVTKRLSGEVTGTVPEAKDIPTAKGLKRVNPRHRLVWEVELKSGQQQTLSYEYEVYVRS